MVGLRTLNEYNSDMYANALIATFTRLNIIKVNHLYSYGWGYDPCISMPLKNCTLNNLNI